MRLARRLGDAARAAARDLTGGRAATLVYARIIDGEHLWLALTDAEHAHLLHDGRDVTPPDDAPADPDHLSVRWDLTALPGDEPETTYVVSADGRPVAPAPLPPVSPMRTPPTRDGRWQFDLRTDGEALTVVRRRHAPAAEVLDLGVHDGQAVLRLSDPGTAERPELRLTSADGHAATLSLTGSDGGWLARIRCSMVPDQPGGAWLLDLVDGDRRWPVTRAHNALAFPGRAVAGPILSRGGGAGGEVRIGYRQDGRLRIQRPAEDA